MPDPEPLLDELAAEVELRAATMPLLREPPAVRVTGVEAGPAPPDPLRVHFVLERDEADVTYEYVLDGVEALIDDLASGMMSGEEAATIVLANLAEQLQSGLIGLPRALRSGRIRALR